MSYLSPSTAWTTVYSRDFSALSDADLLSGGDGAKVVDGKGWTLTNSAAATTVDVGASYGGIQIVQPTGVAKSLYDGTRTSPHLSTLLGQYLVGTPFEGLSAVELRVSLRKIPVGAVSASGEATIAALTTNTYNANYYHLAYQGDNSGVKGLQSDRFPGTTIGGQTHVSSSTTPVVGYYPNCVRFSILEGLISTIEYSDDGAASIAAAQWATMLWKLRTTSQYPIVSPQSANTGLRMELHIGVHKFGTGNLAGVTLQEMLIEARISPLGGIVLLA